MVSCALFSFAGKTLYRFGARKTLSVSAALFVLSIWGTAHVTTRSGLYFMVAFQGLGGIQLLMFCTPVILDHWFAEKKGFSIGLSSACAGVMGAVMNPVFCGLNERWGWRTVLSGATVASGLLLLPARPWVRISKVLSTTIRRLFTPCLSLWTTMAV
jgi:MFS transporter